MRRAGYPYDPKTGRGGYPQTIVYTAYQQGLAESTAQVLQQELAKIGLRIEIRLLSTAAWAVVTSARGQAAMAPRNNSEDYPGRGKLPRSVRERCHRRGDERVSGSFYKNAAFDRTLSRARREIDREKRRALFR